MKTTTDKREPIAVKAWVENRHIFLELANNQLISFPASRFRQLKDAPDHLLAKVKIEVNGHALRWEELDEDISVPGVIKGHFELPPETK